MSFNVPVVFCIYNRPAETARVFEAIANRKPRHLLVVSDGPKPDSIQDKENVELARAVIENVDWPCHVHTNFSDINLGCKQRMATGISWAFDMHERAIILEDDCLPNESFFAYCANLLTKYDRNAQVMTISGDCFQPQRRTEYSYYFSRWPHIWGWASWRRAWRHFDVNMRTWPALRADKSLLKNVNSLPEYHFWESLFDRQYRGDIDTWDFPWLYACWANQGLTILPEANLVTNIGFGDQATHTLDPKSPLANRPTKPLGPLHHPLKVAAHVEADQWTFDNILNPKKKTAKQNWLSRLFHRRAG